MSPEAKKNFEAEWGVLSRRLRLMLARKRVPACQVDDVLQETALRLLHMWESVDRSRALWPLTATIALNLLRDRSRVGQRHDLVAQLPEVKAIHDVEIAGLARLELERVRQAMDELSLPQRAALMKEIGAHTAACAPDAAGDKMLRMRARRKLRTLVERVSGLVALRLRHVSQFAEGAVVFQDSALKAGTCVICVVLGVGATVIVGPLAPAASARTTPVSIAYLSVLVDQPGQTKPLLQPHAATAEARLARRLARELDAPRVRSANSKEAPSGGGRAQEGLTQVVPSELDEEVSVSDDTLEAPDTGTPPPLPGGGGDGTTLEPPPAPPPPPMPEPPSDNGGGVPPAVTEVVDAVL